MSTITDPEFPKVNMIGYKFKIDTGIDLSVASVLELAFFKPTGSVVQVSATIADIQYLSYATLVSTASAATLLNIAGNWSVLPYIETPDFKGYGESTEFIVQGEYE